MIPKTIHEHVLLGITRAIETRAPELLPTIQEVRDSGYVHPSPDGNSGYGLLEANVPKDKADSILDTLVRIETSEGTDATFEGWQIGFLKLCWRRFTG
jgi:hypothetical protein